MSKYKYFILLHLLVLITSFVPLIGIYISLPVIEIVFLRTLLAVIFAGVFMVVRNYQIKVNKKDLIGLITSGILTSISWISLLSAAKLANASVSLIGIATGPLWASLLLPAFIKQKISFYQVMIGLNAIFGIYVIFNSGFTYQWELLLAIFAAAMGATVNIMNSRFISLYNEFQITFWQMVGALAGTTVFFVIYGQFTEVLLFPSFNDIWLIILLAVGFSIVLNSLLVKTLKFISPFNVTLAGNLSPVYGILSALLFLGSHEFMTIYFYAGGIIVVVSVFAYPAVEYFFNNTIDEDEEDDDLFAVYTESEKLVS